MQPLFKLKLVSTTTTSVDEHDDRSLGRPDIEVGPLRKPSLVGRRVLKANSVAHGKMKRSKVLDRLSKATARFQSESSQAVRDLARLTSRRSTVGRDGDDGVGIREKIGGFLEARGSEVEAAKLMPDEASFAVEGSGLDEQRWNARDIASEGEDIRGEGEDFGGDVVGLGEFITERLENETKDRGARIITPKATREITILFLQKLNGAWTTFTEYPNSELETLYARYRAQRSKHKQPDEEVKKAFVESVEHHYSDWMFRIRNPIFQKYEKKEDPYKNGPSFIPTPFWKEMVDKWMVGDWGETSLTNKDNINKSKIFSTTGSVPMAKYRYEMYLEMGSEPSPIDCFKKFHTKKDGKEWATDHAKTLYEKMDAIKAKVVSEGTKTNDYQIFCEVVGEPSHGRVLGMGIGCSKRCREDFTKEKEDLEARLREEMDSKLAKVVENLEEKFAQQLQSMGIPQQSNIDAATTDGTSRDKEDNSNNNIEVENNLESDSEED
ncbi:hypothetical protein SO802_001083 [Lithocarpus litseifolius]|uniref:Transposase, Ptta/En/Spm, plant n=1 Tax=Lithocarpus litseifolius TaxID=425828 RepID=A0AAW2DV37_9ROSI